jgi:iron complex transport system permease protein
MKTAEIIEQKVSDAPAFEAHLFLTKRRALAVIVLLCILLSGAVVFSLAVGSEPIALGEIVAGLWAKLTGAPQPLTREHEVIIFSLRLPRLALALGVGASLAVAGAAFQSLLRNPLADPYVLGISSGAALGSILAIIFLHQAPLSRPLCGFAGAAITTVLVYWLGRREDEPARLLLAGVIVTTFLSSVIVMLTVVADDVRLRNITIWLLGDLSSGSVQGLAIIAAAVMMGATVLVSQARALNLMMIGERDAFALGVETARVRWVVFFTASLLTGAAVSAGGAIGYVGLVVPHLVRLAAGADNRLVIPASALTGAWLVLVADTAARTLMAPRELPTGAITALIGAPLFIYLLMKGR